MKHTSHRQRHQRVGPNLSAAPISGTTRAEAAGVGASAAPIFGEEIKGMAERGQKRAFELVEELAERVPSPMLTGLVAGAVVGATAMHFLGPKRQDSHAARVEAE